MPRPGAALLGIAGVALLGAGFGIGVLVSSQGAPQIEYRDRPATTAADPVPAPTAPPLPKAGPIPAAAPGGTAPLLAEDDRETLRALLGKIPDREIPSGSGSITGSAKTEDGRRLEGVEISLQPDMPRPPGPVAPQPADPDPVDVVAEYARNIRWWKLAKRAATTDAAGEFRFEGLADVKHRASAKKKGWQFRTKDVRAGHEARPGAVLEFLATPAVDVRVEATMPDGTPAAQFQVRFQSGSSNTTLGVGPWNPVLQVKPGEYEVTATAGDSEEFRSEPQAVTLTAEVEAPPLRFTLKGNPTIQGRVQFAEGEEPESTQVFLQLLTGEARPDAAKLRGTGTNESTHGRNDGHRFRFRDLAPGRYAIGAARWYGGPPVVCEEVTVGEGPVTRDLRIPPADRSEYFVLRVLGPDGKPVTDFTITLGYKGPNGSSSGGTNATVSRPDGSKWVFGAGTRVASEEGATYWIAVHTPKLGQARSEYRRGSQDEVLLRFEEPGRVEATLTGAAGSPFDGRFSFALVPAADVNQMNYISHRGRERPINAQGLQVLPSIQPGEYVLHLNLEFDSRMITLSRTPINVRPGKNEISVALPALHTVTVTGATGIVMIRKPEDRAFYLHQNPGSDGKATFEGLPEGEYTAQFGGKSQTFRLPGTTEVKF